MKPKKTFKVEDILNVVNTCNKSAHGSREMRQGANIILEHILFETNNYVGYRHLTSADLPSGVLPGVIHGHGIVENVFPDDSRREYSMQQF